jgi:hypothetical protein
MEENHAMASDHRPLVLAALLLTASYSAAETPSAGESGAPTFAPPQVCVEIDRFAKDYGKGIVVTIESQGSDLEKCKAAMVYSDAVGGTGRASST